MVFSCVQKQLSRSVLKEKVSFEVSQNSQENTCARVSILLKLEASACNFIKKDSLAQVFSCEFCEIFLDTFFTEHLWAIASMYGKIFPLQKVIFVFLFFNLIAFINVVGTTDN